MNKKLFNIKNFVTIVTGSSRSIGLKIAAGFYEYGAKVIRIDLNLKKHKLYKFDDYIIDLTKQKLVDRCVNEIKHKYGRIDVLINNAGVTTNSTNFYDEKILKKTLSVNLIAAYNLSNKVCKIMSKRKKGSIINIASDMGIISPDHRIYEPNKKINYKGVNFNTPISYSVAKSGIISMTKYLATYWAKKGIRVNCVSPTGVKKQKQDKQFVKQLSERIPLGRMAKSDELNGAIIYLCSNASSYVTGHNLVVDGGRTIW